MRLDADLTLAEAARLLDKTRSALGRIEKGDTTANVHLVRSAMDVYQVYDPDVLELARAAMRPGWWRPYGVLDRDFIGLETAADRSLEVALVRLPALLQTAEYTRAALSSTGSTWSRARVQKECEVRSIRQQRLTDTRAPLELSVVIDEAALRRPASDSAVMRRQLDHLVGMAEQDSVTISVVPHAVGVHPGMGGAFTVLEFRDDDDPDTLSVRHVAGALLIDKNDEVTASKDIFNAVRSMALPPSESMDFIKKLSADRHSK
jgi:hypothetical protein